MDINATHARSLNIPKDQKAVGAADVPANGAVQKPPVFSSQNVGKEGSPGSLEETNEIVESLEGYMNILQTGISFSVNEETDKVVVTVTNRETDEVIRQIPPEELVTLQKKMKELTGIIFSETV